MTTKQVALASNILTLLIQYGIPAAIALGRAIRAIFGHDLTEAEYAEKVAWLEQDSGIRAILAHADAGGGI